MGVYIKGMGMPKSCSRCFCMASCKLWKNIMAPEFYRHRNCPLVPVQKHGRLIDVDAPLRFEVTVDAKMNHATVDIIAPTVMEAEE